MEIDSAEVVTCTCGSPDFSFYPGAIKAITPQHLRCRMQCYNCNKEWIQEVKMTEYKENSDEQETST